MMKEKNGLHISSQFPDLHQPSTAGWSGSPLGELAAEQTEGGAMFCENRQRKNVALHV